MDAGAWLSKGSALRWMVGDIPQNELSATRFALKPMFLRMGTMPLQHRC